MRNQVDMVNASRYPTEELRELLQIARGEKRHGHVAMNVKNSFGIFRGRAYNGMPSISNRRGGKHDYLVVIRIGRPDRFPFHQHYKNLVTAPAYDLLTWQEAFVSLASHELMHCVQFATNSPISEVEAEKAAFRALERYRASVLRREDAAAFETAEKEYASRMITKRFCEPCWRCRGARDWLVGRTSYPTGDAARLGRSYAKTYLSYIDSLASNVRVSL